MHHFGQSKVMLIADENTWSAGGLAAQSELQKAGYEVEKHLFPANPQPRPTVETAQKLSDLKKENLNLIITETEKAINKDPLKDKEKYLLTYKLETLKNIIQ